MSKISLLGYFIPGYNVAKIFEKLTGGSSGEDFDHEAETFEAYAKYGTNWCRDQDGNVVKVEFTYYPGDGEKDNQIRGQKEFNDYSSNHEKSRDITACRFTPVEHGNIEFEVEHPRPGKYQVNELDVSELEEALYGESRIDSGDQEDRDAGENIPGESDNSSADSWHPLKTAEDSGEGFTSSILGIIAMPFTFIFKHKAVLAGVVGLGVVGVLVLPSLFPGTGYGGLLDDMFGSYTAGFGDIGSEVSYQAGRAVKTISCFGNAGCIREWRLNQTRRPGSEDVGETYELRVENLQVYGSDVGVDVAYQKPETKVPISFLLTNTRHGLKGIDAENVDYRIKVRDERLVGGTDLCETDWIDLEKFGGNPPSDYAGDTLLPGEAVEPLSYSSGNDYLNLEECGLLQPSAGTNMDFILQVKYDYSSQSTLQVDAMSRDHRRSEEIPIEFKNSETADTPVETYIEVRSPILFQDTDNDRTPIPFRSRIGVQTDERNIKYKVDVGGFEMTDSEVTESLDCSGLRKEGENSYKIAGGALDRISKRQREDDWFSNRNQPVPVSCQFQIKETEVDSISPTGETLTMSADVSYTVLQEEQRESFEVANSLCTDYNCPMLVPLQSDSVSKNKDIARKKLGEELDPDDEGYWSKSYAHCGRPQDAQQGCSVIKSFKLKDRSAGPITDQTVQQGEIALNVTGGGDITSEYVQNQTQKLKEDKNTEVDAGLLPPRLVSITEDALESLYTGDCVLNITENPGSAVNGKEWVIQKTEDSSRFNSCG